jgi:Skp family chaperone for outer membrane proteins
MKIKKPLLIVGATALIGTASVIGTGLASAATGSTNSDSLVDKIAQKFKLNKSDVQAVFDQNKADHQAQHQADLKASLDQAVKDGKITSQQEAKILDKLKELKAQHEADHQTMENKTPEERKAAMDAKKTEIEQWAKDNGISPDILKYLRPGGHGHHGPR